VNDKLTGKEMYGYIADSCADNNYWCQRDTNHLDLSKPALDSRGWTKGWNGRKVSWSFVKGTPPGCAAVHVKAWLGVPQAGVAECAHWRSCACICSVYGLEGVMPDLWL